MRMTFLFTVIFGFAAFMSLALPAAEDKDVPRTETNAPVDVLTMNDGRLFKGYVTGIAGLISIRGENGGPVTQIQPAGTRRIDFAGAHTEPTDYSRDAAFLHLPEGSHITAKVKWLRDGSVMIENDYCSGAIPLKGISSISFGINRHVVLPRNDDDTADIAVLAQKPDEKVKCVVTGVYDYGVELRIGGRHSQIGFSDLVAIAPAGSMKYAPDIHAQGPYVMAVMANGDRIIGKMGKMDEKTFSIGTPCAGEIVVKREFINSLEFSQSCLFSRHHLLITDAKGRQVIMLNEDGKVIWQHKGHVTPTDAVVLEDDSILVVSNEQEALVILSPEGKEIRTYGVGFAYPMSAALLPNGNYLVAEYNGNRLAEVTPQGGVKGYYLKGQLLAPRSIRSTSDGCFLVLDGGNSRIVKYSYNEDKIVLSMEVNNAQGMAELPNGAIAVMLRGNDLVVFDKAGLEKWRVATGCFSQGIAVTAEGNVIFCVKGSNGLMVLAEYSPDGKKLREIPLPDPGCEVASIQLVD